MLGIKMGAVLSTDVNSAPEACVIGDIADIQEKIGGCFDCVTITCKGDSGTSFQLVGYVHDEGRILNPPLPINLLASTIFNQELHGDCVILSGTNPESHADDGDSYDLPSVFYEYLVENFYPTMRRSIVFTQVSATAVKLAKELGEISSDDYDYVLETVKELGSSDFAGRVTGLPDRFQRILAKSVGFAMVCMTEMVFGSQETEEE